MIRKQYSVRLSGRGNIPACLSKLKSKGTMIVNLSMYEGVVYFQTNAKGIKQVRKYRRKYRVKVKIDRQDEDSGLTALFSSYRYLIVLILPFIGSFFLWNIEVTSNMPEVSERIEKKLDAAKIKQLRLLSTIPDEAEIRRYLMQDEPSLSWVRFKRNGTTLKIIPMLSPATNINEKSNERPSDLVARTGGIITHFALTSGERVKEIHSTVEKGEMLATGILEQGEKKVTVGAAGAVFADYWIEYKFTVPKEIDYKIQGEEQLEWKVHLPWQKKSGFKERLWPLISREKKMDVKNSRLELKDGAEETILVPLLKEKLLAERGADAVIKDNKILHVTFDDDKVRGTILFHVNDNIAIQRPISKETETID